MKRLSVLFLILLFVFCVQISLAASPFYFIEWSKWFTDDKIEYRYELGFIKTPWVEWINHSDKTITKFKMTTTCEDVDEYTYVKQDVVQYTKVGEHEKALVNVSYHCEVVKVHFSDFVYNK